jgi:thiol:disulfide interchange protein DsbD
MRVVLALLLLLAPVVMAQPHTTPRGTTTLISEVAAVAPGQPFRLMLDQVLARGWHTYWTNPGDAGAPPEITWTLPEGATADPLQFPAPSRIPYGPLVNFGYLNSASFLTTITPPAGLRPGERFSIAAQANWLICAEVCIPEEANFSITLPVEATARPAPGLAGRFAAAEAALPRQNPFAARIGFEGTRGALELTGLPPGELREAYFFPAAEALIDNTAPQPLSLTPGGLALGLTRGTAAIPASLEGVLVLTDAQGVRQAYALSLTPGAMPAIAPVLPLWQAVLFAALGGLILNLMPCVFPILAMKAVGLARLAGEGRGQVRAHAASYSLGVVLSFLAIGAVLLGLRLAGSAAGWGFQFTQAPFVAAMAWVMLAVGLNLSGAYALGGPVLSGSARGGHAGSFATGALAVLVATPCTAPFMAVALGAAMALPPAPMLLVFAAMGLGLALPYAVLALVPGLARLLPRPGAWMERLRQALAFPMYAAAAWLVWVLAQLAGPDGVALGLLGGLLVGFAAWSLGQAQQGAGRLARIGALAGGLGALALLPGFYGASPAPALASGPHEAWSAARVETLRAEGRPVFVNLTAAWCISCKVNERVALETTAVQAAFAERRVAQLVGDWTRGDAAISALLRSHAREGVPLYLLYPAGGGAPVILPQILTEGMLLRAIAEAG